MCCYLLILVALLSSFQLTSDKMGWELLYSKCFWPFLRANFTRRAVLQFAFTFTWLQSCLVWQMESKWNAERQLHDNVRGLLPWSLEFWSAARKRLFWLVRWGCSQRLVCSLHTSSESFEWHEPWYHTALSWNWSWNRLFERERAVGVRKQLAELLASLASFPQDYLYRHWRGCEID